MMQKWRVLIVDDEPLARDGVRLNLDDQQDFEVVGECANGDEAVETIRDVKPDVVFLDVQMPGLDGFGVLDALSGEPLPEIVFVTAYDQFALQAFEAHALDYLLKPFDAERFQKSLQRVRAQLRGQHRDDIEGRLVSLLEELRDKPRYLERLVVRSSGRILILRTDDVDWIEAAANYVKLHVGGRVYLLRETMSHLERNLDPARFVRIHRSTIVRIDRIKLLEPLFQGDYLVILQDGARLPTSRTYRENLQELLGSTR
ncbi:MAG: LytR/AlgR family response regulator transcription factor [Longimicrobiales bacterium]